MTQQNRIVELASIIHKNTIAVDEFLTSHGLPTPSLDIDAPAKIPIPEDAVETQAAHLSAIEAAAELQALLRGPAELVQPGVGNPTIVSSRYF